MMYHMVQFSRDGWQGPAREAARRRDRPHRRARDLRPQPARARGRDRHQPPHADPPLRQPRGAVGGGHPRRRGAPARAAGRGRARPRARPVGDVMRQWWAHISDESLWANERLFFEVYGQALQGRPGTVELLDGIVDSWIEPAAEGFVALRAAARGGAGAGAARARRQPRAAARPAGHRRPRGRRRRDGGATSRSSRQDWPDIQVTNRATDVRVGGYDAEGSSSRSRRSRCPPRRTRRRSRSSTCASRPARRRRRRRPARSSGGSATRRSSTLDPVTRTPRVLARLDGALSARRPAPRRTSRCATCAPTSPRSA